MESNGMTLLSNIRLQGALREDDFEAVSVFKPGDIAISGEEILRRGKELGAVGGEDHGLLLVGWKENLLGRLGGGRKVIFPDTVYQDPNGKQWVPCAWLHDLDGWALALRSIDGSFDESYIFLRRRTATGVAV